jgi:hypothetical protein
MKKSQPPPIFHAAFMLGLYPVGRDEGRNDDRVPHRTGLGDDEDAISKSLDEPDRRCDAGVQPAGAGAG